MGGNKHPARAQTSLGTSYKTIPVSAGPSARARIPLRKQEYLVKESPRAPTHYVPARQILDIAKAAAGLQTSRRAIAGRLLREIYNIDIPLQPDKPPLPVTLLGRPRPHAMLIKTAIEFRPGMIARA